MRMAAVLQRTRKPYRPAKSPNQSSSGDLDLPRRMCSAMANRLIDVVKIPMAR
jgi:hypothetical protein